jgi:hypothetical protein
VHTTGDRTDWELAVPVQRWRFRHHDEDDQRWSLSDFLPLLVQPAAAGTPEAERLYRAVETSAACSSRLSNCRRFDIRHLSSSASSSSKLL